MKIPKRKKNLRAAFKPRPAVKLCPNCGEPGPHFAPPSLGEPGFFVCQSH